MNKDIWNGSIFDFIPLLTQASTLKKKNIISSTRLFEAITNDKVKLYMDSPIPAFYNIISGNTGRVSEDGIYLAGLEGTTEVLGLTPDGYYGTCTFSNKEPVAFVTNTIICDISINNIIKEVEYDKYVINYGILTHERTGAFALPLIKVTPSTNLTFEFSPNFKVEVVEYNNSKNKLTKSYNEIGDHKESFTQTMSVNTEYIGINLFNFDPSLDTNYLKYSETVRDMNYIDFPKEDRNLIAHDFTQYGLSIYRTIEVIGNVEYTLNFGEFSGDIVITELKQNNEEISHTLYKNNTFFTTNVFTKYLKLEIIPTKNTSYKELVNLFRNNKLVPMLTYKDYVNSEEKLLNEKCPEITESGKLKNSNIPIYTINGKIMKINNKFIKQN